MSAVPHPVLSSSVLLEPFRKPLADGLGVAACSKTTLFHGGITIANCNDQSEVNLLLSAIPGRGIKTHSKNSSVF